MGKNRDDFSKVVVDVLAKRVGYLCSNPDCRVHTVGPNTNPQKATSIGKAAHITAAAPGGPRYDPNMSQEDRASEENGIWLCSNHADMIDKDPTKYPVQLLKQWKKDAENEMLQKIQGRGQIAKPTSDEFPFLEPDIIWTHGGRANRGYSNKNSIEIIDGQRVMILADPPYIYWHLDWNYKITLYNNSTKYAFNVKVEQVSPNKFDELTVLNKINNLPALEHIDLEAHNFGFVEGTYIDAEKLHLKLYPERLLGLQLRITYLDAARKEHETISTFENGRFVSVRIK